MRLSPSLARTWWQLRILHPKRRLGERWRDDGQYPDEEHETTSYLVDQDIWSPFIVFAWAQVVLNGVILVVWKRTRLIGVGVLIGALAAADRSSRALARC